MKFIPQVYHKPPLIAVLPLQPCAKGLNRRGSVKEHLSVPKLPAEKTSSTTHLALGPHSLLLPEQHSSSLQGISPRTIPRRPHKTITFGPPNITEASHFFISLVAGQQA